MTFYFLISSLVASVMVWTSRCDFLGIAIQSDGTTNCTSIFFIGCDAYEVQTVAHRKQSYFILTAKCNKRSKLTSSIFESYYWLSWGRVGFLFSWCYVLFCSSSELQNSRVSLSPKEKQPRICTPTKLKRHFQLRYATKPTSSISQVPWLAMLITVCWWGLLIGGWCGVRLVFYRVSID